MATPSSILAWRIHGQRCLAGYSQWGRKELDTNERLMLSLHMLAKFCCLRLNSNRFPGTVFMI